MWMWLDTVSEDKRLMAFPGLLSAGPDAEHRAGLRIHCLKDSLAGTVGAEDQCAHFRSGRSGQGKSGESWGSEQSRSLFSLLLQERGTGC